LRRLTSVRAYYRVRIFSTPLPQRSKKSLLREPEKMTTLPENEELMPENEPEKNLKIQLRLKRVQCAADCDANSKLLGHSNISLKNPPPFTQFQANTSKSPAIHTFRFCSALFRQKIISRLSRRLVHPIRPRLSLPLQTALCYGRPLWKRGNCVQSAKRDQEYSY
jgi:hypothetical protein